MTSRERVLATLEHRSTDRAPVDIGGTAASGFSVFSYSSFKRAMGLPDSDIRAIDIFGMLAFVDGAGADAVGVDTVLAPELCPRFGVKIDRWKEFSFWDGHKYLVPEDMTVQRDEDGALLLMSDGKAVGKMCKGGYYFSEIANSSMSFDCFPDEVPLARDKQFIDSYTDEELRFREKTAKELFESSDKAVIVDVTENIRWDASIPEWLYCIALDPDRANELHEKKSLALLSKIKQLAQATAKYSQVFAIYQDWGTQRSELVHPDVFKAIVAPHYKRIFDWIHQNTEWKVFFHSCGSIFSIIPHMIEMGVDILNPVQTDAANMQPEKLKAAYGDQLVFWGGGIDTQSVMITGTPEQIKEQVQDRIQVLGKNGGYVFAPTQSIQADIPVKNIMAVIEALKGVQM
ncbi:MAG: hypothetical protein FWH55_01295 [Oscillospiraceae bacterium]|nr:hypothetical protein [Oscillospiraceae bacterium]